MKRSEFAELLNTMEPDPARTPVDAASMPVTVYNPVTGQHAAITNVRLGKAGDTVVIEVVW